jgi:hypothetical protein
MQHSEAYQDLLQTFMEYTRKVDDYKRTVQAVIRSKLQSEQNLKECCDKIPDLTEINNTLIRSTREIQLHSSHLDRFKTSRSCDDLPPEQKMHPCDNVNVNFSDVEPFTLRRYDTFPPDKLLNINDHCYSVELLHQWVEDQRRRNVVPITDIYRVPISSVDQKAIRLAANNLLGGSKSKKK